MSIHIKYDLISNQGLVRSSNEDVIEAGTLLKVDTAGQQVKLHYILACDGIGGMQAGGEASKLAAFTVVSYLKSMPFWPTIDDDVRQELTNSVLAAHYKLVDFDSNDQEYTGMGSTIALMVITNNTAFVIWCGDSRIYLLSEKSGMDLGMVQDGVRLITEDHSLVWLNIRNKVLTLDQARNHPQYNVLTQSLGGIYKPEPEVVIFEVHHGDRFLICTDGTNLHADTAEICTILKNSQTPQEAVDQLEKIILSKGARDNFSLGVIFAIDIQWREPVLTNPEKAIDNVKTNKPKKNNKNLYWILLFSLLILLGWFGFEYFKNRQDVQGVDLVGIAGVDTTLSNQPDTLFSPQPDTLSQSKVLTDSDSVSTGNIKKSIIGVKSVGEPPKPGSLAKVQKNPPFSKTEKKHSEKSILYDAIYYNVKRELDQLSQDYPQPDFKMQSYMIHLELLMDEIKDLKSKNDYTNLNKTEWQLEYLRNKFIMIKNKFNTTNSSTQ